MHKFLLDERDRQRQTVEHGKTEAKKQQKHRGQQEEKTRKEAGLNKALKVFPKSVLFKKWGESLTENDQREAEALFQKYGYNVFLSDRLPLDRPLPDTRDPRYTLLEPLQWVT